MRDLLSNADWKARVAEGLPPEIAEEVPLDLFGLITGLPADTAEIPWDGPHVRIIEHPAHAPGHAALLIEERGVLVAGDMLSDVLIPMLDDFDSADDPIEDYLTGLRLLEGVADDVDVLIPGHGSVGGADQVRARIQQDRAYVQALRDGGGPDDPRIGPSAKPGMENDALIRARDAVIAGPRDQLDALDLGCANLAPFVDRGARRGASGAAHEIERRPARAVVDRRGAVRVDADRDAAVEHGNAAETG
jgi:glyoxylase-like metal-dependent hydrolase (beta-lactamase superfamily II)